MATKLTSKKLVATVEPRNAPDFIIRPCPVPSHLNILGHLVTIEEAPSHEMLNNFGLCSITNGTIKISDHISIDQSRSTLLHEVIEFINMALELKLKHGQICGLETGLYQVMKENKNFLGF